MAKVLKCYVDMFALNQSVIFPDGSEARISTEQLETYLPTVCFSHNYDKIHLFGNEEFVQGIANSIYNSEVTMQYGATKKLEIEVN